MMQTFKMTKKQEEANCLLRGPAKHILLRGGARSGKTSLLVRAIIIRALKVTSRHLILRKHFNHVKQSVWLDTLPVVMNLCFPNLSVRCKWDKADWFVTLPNSSEIWIGGLDDKERTEKILGKEFSTIYFTECSEMTYDSVGIAYTRLSQKNDLAKKFYYCCNPPKLGHWSHKLFMLHVDPTGGLDKPLSNPQDYTTIKINPRDNEMNLDPNYIPGILEKLPLALRQRFLDGEFGSDDKDIIRSEWITPSGHIGEIAAKFTFIDPAFTEKAMATDNSCESAIVTVGIDYNGIVHDLEVESGFWSYGDLKAKAIARHKRHSDVRDKYFAVEDVAAQKWLADDLGKAGVNCFAIKPDGDKIRRTISVTDLLEQGRCRVNNPKLRDQLLGFPSEKLKDLVDSFVGCLTMVKKFGAEKYLKQISEEEKYKGLTSHQYWLRKTLEWERRQLLGEADVEYYSEITGEENPDFY